QHSTEGNDADSGFTRVHLLDKSPTDRQSAVEQLIILEPLVSDTLFAAPRAFRLRGALATVFRDKYTGALSSLGTKGRTTYIVSSDVSTPSEQDLRLDAGTT